ncbi:MAG TPA: acyl-CoA dehydrogenase, partial [Chitinophagaceae bacterium]|nr:acyl-CoA dehydrogenase [Chitinophagaceae bacterium]
FSDEYSVSRAYRDSRINRIFEGTNEINRLLSVDMVLKRAMKGRLDILTPAKNVAKELVSIPDFGSGEEGPFAAEKKLIIQFKKAILLTAGAAVQKLMMKLESEQEILMHIADMAMITFHAESALLRVIKLSATRNADALTFEMDVLHTFLYDSADILEKHGKDAVNGFAEGDEQRMLLLGLKRFCKANPFNSKEAKRRIADKLIADGRYPL